MLSVIGLILLISEYSSAFYIKVQILHPDKVEIGPFFLCRNLIKPPPKSNELTLWAIDPSKTTCEAEDGSPEFFIKKPRPDEFDFYDELKRDGKVPYDPTTVYISANKPWGTDYNVPVIVSDKDAPNAPLALSTHIWDPIFPVNFKVLRGGKVRKDITGTKENPVQFGDVLEFFGHPTLIPKWERDLRIDLQISKFAHNTKRYPILRHDLRQPNDPKTPLIVLSVSNEEHFVEVIRGRGEAWEREERDFQVWKKRKETKENARKYISGIFGGIKKGASNFKDKVGAGLARIQQYGQKEEEKEDYPENSPDPAEQGGEWDKTFDIYQDVDPEHIGPIQDTMIKELPGADEKIPIDSSLDAGTEEKIPLDIPLEDLGTNQNDG